MTKRDLVMTISKETGIIQHKVLQVVQRTLDYICNAVAKGFAVELRKFGTFEVRVRKARVGRNLKMPVNDVLIPSRAVARFRPGREMRAAVLKLPTK